MAEGELETPRTLNIDVVEVPSTFANTATNSPSSDATGLLGKVIWFEIFITTFGAVGWQSGYDGGWTRVTPVCIGRLRDLDVGKVLCATGSLRRDDPHIRASDNKGRR